MIALTADIGGTNSRFQILDMQGAESRVLWRSQYRNAEFHCFDAVLSLCLKDAPQAYRPETACLATAGPVIDASVRLTNLPWTLSAAGLAERFQLHNVQLLNDLEAAAYAVDQLEGRDLRVLQAGTAVSHKPGVVVGVGTGFGQAMFARIEEQTVVFNSEGGHVDFAPTTAREDDLLAVLRKTYPRVSVETVLSASGLRRILQYLQDQSLDDGLQLSVDAIIRLWQLDIPSPTRAVDLFASILASQLANIALSCNAFGGITLVGGLLNALQPRLSERSFSDTFCDRPAFSSLLQKIPIHLVADTDIGLKGAEVYLQQSLVPITSERQHHVNYLYPGH